MISPSALLLDLDGTVADSLPAMRHAYDAFLGQFHIEPTDAEFNALNGPTLAEVVRRLRVSHALDMDESILIARYLHVVDQAYASVLPRHGTEELLRNAKSHLCEIAIVTSNTSRRAHTWLNTVGLSHYVDFVVSGDDVTRGKPDPEPYRTAAMRMQCSLAQIVAVEDSPQGAKSAVDAGLNTFVLTGEFMREIWPNGVIPISSLGSLAQKLW